MPPQKWTKSSTLWTPDARRSRGRPRKRWRHDLDRFEPNWPEVAEDRDRWKRMGEAFAQQWDSMGMVGYSRLEVRREVGMMRYLWRVLRGEVHHPDVLEALQLRVPTESTELLRPRPHQLLHVPTARTKLLKRTPMTRAILAINIVARGIDIFSCSLPKFTEMAYRFLENNN